MINSTHSGRLCKFSTGGYVFYVYMLLHVKCNLSITKAGSAKAGLIFFLSPVAIFGSIFVKCLVSFLFALGLR